jgi:ribose transport system ATP-binding protein
MLKDSSGISARTTRHVATCRYGIAGNSDIWLQLPGAPVGVSFDARRGEIIGFAGLVGSGRTELMQVIFGVDPSLGGQMLLNGKAYAPRNTRDAIHSGVYLAPEDRKRHGLVLPMSVAQNTSLPDVANYTPRFWLNRNTEQ